MHIVEIRKLTPITRNCDVKIPVLLRLVINRIASLKKGMLQEWLKIHKVAAVLGFLLALSTGTIAQVADPEYKSSGNQVIKDVIGAVKTQSLVKGKHIVTGARDNIGKMADTLKAKWVVFREGELNSSTGFGQREGTLITEAPLPLYKLDGRMRLSILSVPLIISGNLSNENNPERQPSNRISLELDLNRWMYEKEQSLVRQIKAIEQQVGYNQLKVFDTLDHVLAKGQTKFMDSIGSMAFNPPSGGLKGSAKAILGTNPISTNDSIPDYLPTKTIKSVTEGEPRGEVNKPVGTSDPYIKALSQRRDSLTKHYPERMEQYEQLKRLKAHQQSLRARMAGLADWKNGLSIRQFRLGVHYPMIHRAFVFGIALDGIGFGASLGKVNLSSGAGVARYNRSLLRTPETRLGYVSLDLKHGQKDVISLGISYAADQAGYQIPLDLPPATIDSVRSIIPKRNLVVGMSLKQQVLRRVQITADQYISNTQFDLGQLTPITLGSYSNNQNTGLHTTLSATYSAAKMKVDAAFTRTDAAYYTAGNPYLRAGWQQVLLSVTIKPMMGWIPSATILHGSNVGGNKQLSAEQLTVNLSKTHKQKLSTNASLLVNQAWVAGTKLNDATSEPKMLAYQHRFVTWQGGGQVSYTSPFGQWSIISSIEMVLGSEDDRLDGFETAPQSFIGYGPKIGLRGHGLDTKLGYVRRYNAHSSSLIGGWYPAGYADLMSFEGTYRIGRLELVGSLLSTQYDKKNYSTLSCIKVGYIISATYQVGAKIETNTIKNSHIGYKYRSNSAFLSIKVVF